MWEALENLSWIQTLGSTDWMYSTVAVTHYLSFFWCVGSVVLVDLRVVGIVARNRKVGELADQLFPWAWIGFALAMISGFFMFATDASAWAPSPVFHVKLTLIAVSAIFTYFVQRGVHKWALNPEIPQAAKIIALISLLLWVATILSASEIPALEGLG